MARRDDPGDGVPGGHLSSRGSGESCAGQAAIETARCRGGGQTQPVAAQVPGAAGEQTRVGRPGRRSLLVGDH